MSQVLSTLYSLGSLAASKGVSGPMIGTKYAAANKRDFDEETQRAGRNVIGLQVRNHTTEFRYSFITLLIKGGCGGLWLLQ